MTATDLNMRLTLASGITRDTHPDDADAALAHDTTLQVGRRVWWRHPRTNQVIHGEIIGRRRGSLEVFVRADGQGPSQWWSLPTYVLHVDAPRERVWWPERVTVPNHDGYTETVAIGAAGHATCTCRPDDDPTPVTAPDPCEHIRAVRDSQDDPWRHGFGVMEDVALADEAWRGGDRAAAAATKILRAMHDTRHRIALHEEARDRPTTTATDAIQRFGDHQ